MAWSCATAAEEADDGLSGGEGTFLVCSFWMADALAMIGRRDAAQELFERLLAMRNDLGLLAEEYDPVAKRQLGNFPQAFSHVGIVNSANNLIADNGPAKQRAAGAASGGGLARTPHREMAAAGGPRRMGGLLGIEARLTLAPHHEAALPHGARQAYQRSLTKRLPVSA